MLGLGLSTVAINDQQEIGAGKFVFTLEIPPITNV